MSDANKTTSVLQELEQATKQLAVASFFEGMRLGLIAGSAITFLACITFFSIFF